MSYKVSYWNINTGSTSFSTRISTLSSWCKKEYPDLLFLEEVGSTITDRKLRAITGLVPIAHVNTLDKNGKTSTKNLWALSRAGSSFTGRAMAFPGLDQKRLSIKVTSFNSRYFAAWGMHANASASGGRKATSAALSYIKSQAGRATIVGGDFNYPALSIPQNDRKYVILSKNWRGGIQKFTQWNKTEGTTYSPNASLYLISKLRNPVIYRKVLKHDLIDYIIKGNSIKVSSLRVCQSEETWIQILRDFDHCPVQYSIG